MLEAAGTGMYVALIGLCGLFLGAALLHEIIEFLGSKRNILLFLVLPVIVIALGALAGIASYLTH
jgi:hypothetical protein